MNDDVRVSWYGRRFVVSNGPVGVALDIGDGLAVRDVREMGYTIFDAMTGRTVKPVRVEVDQDYVRGLVAHLVHQEREAVLRHFFERLRDAESYEAFRAAVLAEDTAKRLLGGT